MLYRKMPKTGDELSILGFGCMRLPTTKEGQIDEDRAVSQIRSAVDRGVNYLDTAWPYHGGKSEPLLGKAVRDGYRDKVRLATKLPSWMVKSRDDMDRYLDMQLEKLGTDRIDYYLLHTLNGKNWAHLQKNQVADFMDRALADGRIINAGFSFHGLLNDFKRIVDDYPWTFCQIQYNYLDQENQAGTAGLEYAASKNLGVVVMEPLRGGNLGTPEAPPEVTKIWDQAGTKRTPVEWALRWIWNHPEVTVVLSGMNEEAHVDQNLAIAESAHAGSLSQEELRIVDQAAAKYKELMAVGCTGCGYCMPCPEGVNIPGIFEVYNKMSMFGDRAAAKFSYTVRTLGLQAEAAPGFASNCVRCGECLDKCPQEIAIPDHLEDVVAELEGPDFADRIATVKERFGLS